MAISGDYPSSVFVNGYACRNCNDVSLAQKHIDPAHPKSGAFGADAPRDPTASDAAKRASSGAQARLIAAEPPGYTPAGRTVAARPVGRLLDLAG